MRDLGKVGVIADPSAYELPPNAFNRANNVVFNNGHCERAPIFKEVFPAQVAITVGTIISQTETSGVDTFYVADRDYNVYKWVYPNFTDLTTANQQYLSTTTTSTTDVTPMTSTALADVIYINKGDRRPIYKLPSENFFRELYPTAGAPNSPTSTWGSSSDVWKCQSLRSYGDFLIALNMNEGAAGDFASRVRWCDPVTSGSAAVSWDASDATTLAGFNDLIQINGGIVDGLSLGNQFIIYSEDQVWLMDFVGGQFVFNFRRLFTDAGLCNHNCVVEVEGSHYCFGKDDIYVHNGTQKQSICNSIVRDFIFNNLDSAKFNYNFVHHDLRFKKIMFCYFSSDEDVNYDKANYVNKAAVYSYSENTWSFMDLPNLTASGVGNLSAVINYDATQTDASGSSVDPTYESIGGTYQDTAGSVKRHSLFGTKSIRIDASVATYPVPANNTYHGLTTDSLICLDSLKDPAVVAQYKSQFNSPVILERTGIDMDNAGMDLRTYKSITKLYPQIDVFDDFGTTVNIAIGAHDLPHSDPEYPTTVAFNPLTDYKIDVRAAGRYLAYKITLDSADKYFSLTGFDAEFMALAKR
tara:strand:+ start:3986 stop:5731 length:1746 start_codon:yes stop_codon:yes gene_type:complete